MQDTIPIGKEISTIPFQIEKRTMSGGTRQVSFINWLGKVNWPPLRDLNLLTVLNLLVVLNPFNGGKFTISTQLIKPIYLIILLADAAPQFLSKLTPLFICLKIVSSFQMDFPENDAFDFKEIARYFWLDGSYKYIPSHLEMYVTVWHTL